MWGEYEIAGTTLSPTGEPGTLFWEYGICGECGYEEQDVHFDTVGILPLAAGTFTTFWHESIPTDVVYGGPAVAKTNPELSEDHFRAVVGSGTHPVVVANADGGGGLVAWNDVGTLTVRRVKPDGKLDPALKLAPDSIVLSDVFDVARSSSGLYMVAWREGESGAAGSSIGSQVFNEALEKESGTLMVVEAQEGETGGLSLDSLPPSAFVVAFVQGAGVMARCWDSAQMSWGAPILIGAGTAYPNNVARPVDVVGLAPDSFAVVWTSDDDDGRGVSLAAYSCDGEELVDMQTVNSSISNDQLNAAIAATPYGLLVVWQGCPGSSVGGDYPDFDYDGSCGVFSQSYGVHGQKLWKHCNDGLCDDGESCFSCPKDCGLCRDPQ
jgi:hypothetical protein